MKSDPLQLYSQASEFFRLCGSVVMKLDSEAAIQVCRQCADHGLVVARIEGGVWHSPGFEPRLDCIWNGMDPPIDYEGAVSNNREAAEFISCQRATHNAFILTAPPMLGWPHKAV